ncbi:hypothetical protein [Marinilabilia sp.]
MAQLVPGTQKSVPGQLKTSRDSQKMPGGAFKTPGKPQIFPGRVKYSRERKKRM